MTAPTVYDRMCWPQPLLEQALATGAHERELHAYLGDAEYSLLSGLARRAAKVSTPADAPGVYLLPGILGSQLGLPRMAPEPPDLLWLDPDDIVEGRLIELRPGHHAGLRALGAVVYNYLPLRLRLAATGLRTVLYDYDWRQDLMVSAHALALRLDADPAARLILVGHSMGGLLARAALPLCDARTRARVQQFIGLGAPHGGSMAAVQALRATYPVILRLAAMDRLHSATTLTMEAFRDFHSLYQMLPGRLPAGRRGDDTGLNFFLPSTWPTAGAVPDPGLLELAEGFHAQLAPADERFVSIIGTGQRTVTSVSRDEREFRYEITSAGDGTVAVSRATLPGARVYSLRCEHSELPRSLTVAAAIVDLIRSGDTQRLTAGVTLRHGKRVQLTDSAIQRELDLQLDWHALSVAERRRYLDHLSDPPASYLAAMQKL